MQSIQSVLDEIEADIIAITETKLNTDRNKNIPGYKWIGRPRLNKEGGVVGVFVKQEITQSMCHIEDLICVPWFPVLCYLFSHG